jgi:hypothetical protein
MVALGEKGKGGKKEKNVGEGGGRREKKKSRTPIDRKEAERGKKRKTSVELNAKSSWFVYSCKTRKTICRSHLLTRPSLLPFAPRPSFLHG